MIKFAQELVSVDTSVWIDFFRDVSKKKYPELRHLISENLVAVCEPVVAEVLTGSKNDKEYAYNDFMMRSNIILETPDAIWENISQARYQLKRMGHKVYFLDLWVAYSAYYAKTYLWTLDKDFEIIQKVIPFKFFESREKR